MAYRSLLKETLLFGSLPENILEQVCAALKSRQLSAGEVLFNLGDQGEELIIVESGAIAIFSPIEEAANSGQVIRIFKPGEILGEMAVLDSKPRSLSARAEQPSTVLSLNRIDFLKLLSENFNLTMAIIGGLSERVRYTTDFLTEVRQWVRHISDGNYQQPAGPIDALSTQDKNLSALAAEFARMAAQVKQREDEMRREIAQLRIEIDDSKRKQDVQEIMNSDYYQDLRTKLRQMREQNQEDE